MRDACPAWPTSQLCQSVHPALMHPASSGAPGASAPSRPCWRLKQQRGGAGKRVVHLIVSRTATGSSVRFVAAFATSYLNSPWGQRQVCCTCSVVLCDSLAKPGMPDRPCAKAFPHRVAARAHSMGEAK